MWFYVFAIVVLRGLVVLVDNEFGAIWELILRFEIGSFSLRGNRMDRKKNFFFHQKSGSS